MKDHTAGHVDIWPITDVRALRTGRKIVKVLTDSELSLRRTELKKRHWVAVPVSRGLTGTHFTDEEVMYLSAVFSQLGFLECVAISVLESRHYPEAFGLRPTEDGLNGFNYACGGMSYLLTTMEAHFAFLCADEAFKVFSGERSTVETFLGVTLDEARERFTRYAKAVGNPPGLREHLLFQARLYADPGY